MAVSSVSGSQSVYTNAQLREMQKEDERRKAEADKAAEQARQQAATPKPVANSEGQMTGKTVNTTA